MYIERERGSLFFWIDIDSFVNQRMVCVFKYYSYSPVQIHTLRDFCNNLSRVVVCNYKKPRRTVEFPNVSVMTRNVTGTFKHQQVSFFFFTTMH